MNEEVRKYWDGFPEAPASDTLKWVDADGYEHMTTVRAWTAQSLATMIEQLKNTIASMDGKPAGKAAPLPQQTIPLRDENGTPVIDAETRQPVMSSLPDGVHLFTVAGLAHDKTKNGKDVMKVWTVEEPYNKGYGVSCFHPPAEVGNWKAWQLMSRENKTRYAPPSGFEHVLIRDPKQEGGYPDIVEFRP